MPLPDTFQFSQNRLQDFVDCPRRFELRWVLTQPWPALLPEQPAKFEQQMQRGSALHHLAHQAALGLDPERLAATIHDPLLAEWWRAFQDHPPANLPSASRWPEITLSAPLGGYRLRAKYDLLAVEPRERLVIVDWKGVQKPPSRAALARRLQTRVYRFLAVRAGASVNGGQPPWPEQVEMVYWFAAQGGRCQRFPYDARQYAADADYLAGLIADIAARQEPGWPLTEDERRCRFCQYRSYCQRQVEPFFVADLEDDWEEEEDMDIDLVQIAEIEF